MELIYKPPSPEKLEWAKKKFPWLGKEWIIKIPQEKNMVDLANIPPHFTEGYRGVLLLKRKKDGGEEIDHRLTMQRISRSAGEWMANILFYRELQKDAFKDYRIYSSVNARDPAKAIREFKRRQLDHDYEEIHRQFEFYNYSSNRFFSCFMNPIAKAESNFLIDCDSVEEYRHAQEVIDPELVIFQYPTKNGWHMVTKPFNPTGLNLQIKKDDLLYIG